VWTVGVHACNFLLIKAPGVPPHTNKHLRPSALEDGERPTLSYLMQCSVRKVFPNRLASSAHAAASAERGCCFLSTQ